MAGALGLVSFIDKRVGDKGQIEERSTD